MSAFPRRLSTQLREPIRHRLAQDDLAAPVLDDVEEGQAHAEAHQPRSHHGCVNAIRADATAVRYAVKIGPICSATPTSLCARRNARPGRHRALWGLRSSRSSTLQVTRAAPTSTAEQAVRRRADVCAPQDRRSGQIRALLEQLAAARCRVRAKDVDLAEPAQPSTRDEQIGEITPDFRRCSRRRPRPEGPPSSGCLRLLGHCVVEEPIDDERRRAEALEDRFGTVGPERSASAEVDPAQLAGGSARPRSSCRTRSSPLVSNIGMHMRDPTLVGIDRMRAARSRSSSRARRTDRRRPFDPAASIRHRTASSKSSRNSSAYAPVPRVSERRDVPIGAAHLSPVRRPGRGDMTRQHHLDAEVWRRARLDALPQETRMRTTRGSATARRRPRTPAVAIQTRPSSFRWARDVERPACAQVSEGVHPRGRSRTITSAASSPTIKSTLFAPYRRHSSATSRASDTLRALRARAPRALCGCRGDLRPIPEGPLRSRPPRHPATPRPTLRSAQHRTGHLEIAAQKYARPDARVTTPSATHARDLADQIPAVCGGGVRRSSAARLSVRSSSPRSRQTRARARILTRQNVGTLACSLHGSARTSPSSR